MRKPSVALSVVGSFISIFGLAPAVEATPTGGNKINLKELYSTANGGIPACNAGNFLEMTDGNILFFNPKIRNDLRAALADPRKSFNANFLVFSPATRTSKMTTLMVRKNANTLLFDAHSAKDSEIERTMLSPDWSAVYDFCKTSLYKNSDPRNLRFGEPNAVAFSGVTRLPNGQFLITCGMKSLVHPDEASLAVSRTATVFNCSSRSAVKSFKLWQSRSSHLSLLLPDGRVLLVGGGIHAGSTSIELVDPEAGTSRLLACPLKERDFATVCLDSRGNCLLLGGYDSKLLSTGLIERIDVQKETITKISDFEIPRSYISSLRDLNQVSLNAIALSDHRILISGGSTKVWWYTDGDFNRDDAEVFTIKN